MCSKETKLKLFMFLALAALVGFIIVQNRKIEIQKTQAATCPIKDIGNFCFQGSNTLFHSTAQLDCGVKDFNDANPGGSATACDFNTYPGTLCNTSAVNAKKCASGQICDCNTNCRIPGASPNGVACCTNTVCESGYCNLSTGICEPSPTAAPTITITSSPSAGSSPTPTSGLTTKDILPRYTPLQFNSLVAQSGLVLLGFLVIFWIL